uniref:Uncharacterized protein AlNc14C4G607 n=1 Tax=Albugo laibachii Nc14 TaxID=890382 RepID=F0W0G5_9STRA|nr:conserved hypothetical protein [Albugo laibachii Nc14]|eukprot:CCA14537.1 conserved hypothetical protein [Albugo laibachii Nc14]
MSTSLFLHVITEYSFEFDRMETDEPGDNNMTAASSREISASECDVQTAEDSPVETSDISHSNDENEISLNENADSDDKLTSSSGGVECKEISPESTVREEPAEKFDTSDSEELAGNSCLECKTQDEMYTIYWESDVLGLILKPNLLGQAVIRRVTSEGKAKGLKEARVGDILCSINQQSIEAFSFQMITSRLKSLILPIQLGFSAVYNQRPTSVRNLTEMDNMWRREPSSFSNSEESASTYTDTGIHNEDDNSSQISNTTRSFRTNLGEDYEFDVVWESGSLGCAFKQRNELPVVKSLSETIETLSIRQIQPGDILLLVNGLRTELLGFKTTVYILKSAPKPVFLRFQRNLLSTAADTMLSIRTELGQDESRQTEMVKETHQMGSDTMHYVVLWSEGSLGIQVKAGEDGLVYVLQITGPGGVSPVSDKIAVGDILVRVADKKIGQIGTAAAFNILRKVVKPVELAFQHVVISTSEVEQAEDNSPEVANDLISSVSIMEKAENGSAEAHATNSNSLSHGSIYSVDSAPVLGEICDHLIAHIVEDKPVVGTQVLQDSSAGLKSFREMSDMSLGRESQSSNTGEGDPGCRKEVDTINAANYAHGRQSDNVDVVEPVVEKVSAEADENPYFGHEKKVTEGEERSVCGGDKEPAGGEESVIFGDAEEVADGEESPTCSEKKDPGEAEEISIIGEEEEGGERKENSNRGEEKDADEDEESPLCDQENEHAEGEESFIVGEEKEAGEENLIYGEENNAEGVESSTNTKEKDSTEGEENPSCDDEREIIGGAEKSICGEDIAAADDSEGLVIDQEEEAAEGEESPVIGDKRELVSTESCSKHDVQTEDENPASTDLDISLYSQFRLRNIQNRDPPRFSDVESGHLKVTSILDAYSPPSYAELYPERVEELTGDIRIPLEDLTMSKLFSPPKVAQGTGNFKDALLPSARSRLTKYRIRWEQGLLGITFKRTKGKIIVSRLTGQSDCEGLQRVQPGDWLYAINDLKTLPMRLGEAMEILKSTSKPVKLHFIAS